MKILKDILQKFKVNLVLLIIIANAVIMVIWLIFQPLIILFYSV